MSHPWCSQHTSTDTVLFCATLLQRIQPRDIFGLSEIQEGDDTGPAILFRSTAGHPHNVQLDGTRIDIKGALAADGIETSHTNRTVETIFAVLHTAAASIAMFTLESGVKWQLSMDHIVANTYTVLRTSCFSTRTKPMDDFFCRSVDFLYETYGHGMGNAIDIRSHAGTPATPAPPPRQPSTGSGNELLAAAREGSKRRTVALLSAGAIYIDEGDPVGYTPLILAAYFQHPSIVKTLLRAGADVSAATVEGYTALNASVENGNLAIATMLVNAGANVNARYVDGRYPLFRAAINQSLGMATLLVKAGARPDMPFIEGETALHVAAMLGTLSMVRLFIDHGVNLNVRMRGGHTALHRAAQCGHGGIITALLAAGADPLLGANDGTAVIVPLDYAVAKGVDVVQSLLVGGNGIEGCGGESGGVTALRYAATTSALDTIVVLSKAGAVDDGGALIVAINNTDAACVRLLVRLWQENRQRYPHYINTTFSKQRQPHGMTATLGSVTPLTLAIRRFQKYASHKIVKHLIEVGADTMLPVAVDISKTHDMMTPFAVVEICHSLHDTMSCDDAHAGERLAAIGKLLHQAEAICASSWLWPSLGVGETKHSVNSRAPNASFTLMLRGMRRRIGRNKFRIALLSHEARAARVRLGTAS